MLTQKIKECNKCGQGFDCDNNPVGKPIPSIFCGNGLHEGLLVPVPAPLLQSK
jgi:hypothetical protein